MMQSNTAERAFVFIAAFFVTHFNLESLLFSIHTSFKFVTGEIQERLRKEQRKKLH